MRARIPLAQVEKAMNREKRKADIQAMIPIGQIAQADLDYVDEVVDLAERAGRYLVSMRWCRQVVDGWLDFATGYIVGIFYFQIVPAQPDVPRFVWIIVGDMPPAYFDGETHYSSYEALDAYVKEMQVWVDKVRDGCPLDDDVITVNVPPEKEWAEELKSRLKRIRKLFLGKHGELAERHRLQVAERKR
jgi:hypothetical protein